MPLPLGPSERREVVQASESQEQLALQAARAAPTCSPHRRCRPRRLRAGAVVPCRDRRRSRCSNVVRSARCTAPSCDDRLVPAVRVRRVQLVDLLPALSRLVSRARSISSCMLPRRSQAIALSQATESTGVHCSGL